MTINFMRFSLVKGGQSIPMKGAIWGSLVNLPV